MPTFLYLDTARLGRMCQAAQEADRDFTRLAGEEGCSLYFEQFVRSGFTSLPPGLRTRYSGLSFWSGMAAFKRDLRTAVVIPPERHVFVASRSAQLVRLAARALCVRCENILVTDMEWPAYLQALAAECRRTGKRLTSVPIQDRLLRGEMTQQELTDEIARAYRTENCDGLFLSAVTYRGVRVPIPGIVRAIGTVNRPRLIVADAAQALNHVPLGHDAPSYDLILAGCHKWLRAYHPLGLAFCGRPDTERFVEALTQEMLLQGELDDPLLRYATELESGSGNRFSETVGLAPLFTAAAAVHHAMQASRSRLERFYTQLANSDSVAEMAGGSGWQVMRPCAPLRTGILLFQARRRDTRSAHDDAVRASFQNAGIALTAYAGGWIRTSLPNRPLADSDLQLLRSAFARCA